MWLDIFPSVLWDMIFEYAMCSSVNQNFKILSYEAALLETKLFQRWKEDTQQQLGKKLELTISSVCKSFSKKLSLRSVFLWAWFPSVCVPFIKKRLLQRGYKWKRINLRCSEATASVHLDPILDRKWNDGFHKCEDSMLEEITLVFQRRKIKNWKFLSFDETQICLEDSPFIINSNWRHTYLQSVLRF